MERASNAVRLHRDRFPSRPTRPDGLVWSDRSRCDQQIMVRSPGCAHLGFTGPKYKCPTATLACGSILKVPQALLVPPTNPGGDLRSSNGCAPFDAGRDSAAIHA